MSSFLWASVHAAVLEDKRLNYSFDPLSLPMLRFWSPNKKNENFAP